jgi:hypothetical protein
MTRNSWIERMRAIDIRVYAAVAATLMLIVGVMWIVPTTPTSRSFTFNSPQRGISSARPLALETPVSGRIVNGSDADFYRIDPSDTSIRLDFRVTNSSQTMVPAVRIFDGGDNLILEKAMEYVRSPGANVEGSFLAESKVTYYVQVASQRNTTGSYSLIVSVRQP